MDETIMYISKAVIDPRRAAERFSSSDRYLAHQAVWAMFHDRPKDNPGFVFEVEEMNPLTVVTRSLEPPMDHGGLWAEIETQEVMPQIAEGQRLRFRLNAVATKSFKYGGASKSRHQDVVVAMWYDIPEDRRRQFSLRDLQTEAGLTWLAKQGTRLGFSFDEDEVAVIDYRTHEIRSGKGRRVPLGVLSFTGCLIVTDPNAFVVALTAGIGGGRRFGFGMLRVAPGV